VEPGEQGGYSHAAGVAPTKEEGSRAETETSTPNERRQPVGYTEPAEPTDGADESELRTRLPQRSPWEDPLWTRSEGVERQSVTPEEGLPERENPLSPERRADPDLL